MRALYRWLKRRRWPKEIRHLPEPESLVALWDHPWPWLRLIGLRLQRMERPQEYP